MSGAGAGNKDVMLLQFQQIALRLLLVASCCIVFAYYLYPNGSSDKSSIFRAKFSQSHSMARFASLLVLACAPARVAADDILLASFDGKATHSWKQMNDPAPRANFGFLTLILLYILMEMSLSVADSFPSLI